MLARGIHFKLTTQNIETGFLAGHEFRQAQTGLSIEFIHQDQNYDLAYPTPLFGPPWSIPMEFPLYQWVSAWLMSQQEFSTELAGRTVSITFFYICLPAIVLLLRSARINLPHISYVLVLVLTAPVFIYYSRAILIESTALCFSLWFLYGFVRMSKTPRWYWFALTAICGSLAALVKITTFMVWGIGALVGGIWWYFRIRQSGNSRKANHHLLWAAMAALPIVFFGVWWINKADQIKLGSADGQFLTSSNLREFNLGTWNNRLELDLWSGLLSNFSTVVFSAWLFGLLSVAALALVIMRKSSLPLLYVAWTAAIWLTFPGLYHIHDYYFYAVALLPLFALGFTLFEFHHNRVGQIIAPAVVVAMSAVQLQAYFRVYAPMQAVVSNGGSPMENFIRDAFPDDAVMIVLGQDWSPAVAYHMKRRCLMIRYEVARNPSALAKLLESWREVPVAGLLVSNSDEFDDQLISDLIEDFDLESQVLVSDDRFDLRVNQTLRYQLLDYMSKYPHNHALTRSDEVEKEATPSINRDPIIADGQIYPTTHNQSLSVFYMIDPTPTHYRTQLGIGVRFSSHGFIMISHPESDIWINVPSAGKEISAEFGVQDEAWADSADHTDGVNFQIWNEYEDGRESLLFERFADPFNQPDDRGRLSVKVELPSPLPARIRISTRPGINGAYDWAFWGNVVIQ